MWMSSSFFCLNNVSLYYKSINNNTIDKHKYEDMILRSQILKSCYGKRTQIYL